MMHGGCSNRTSIILWTIVVTAFWGCVSSHQQRKPDPARAASPEMPTGKERASASVESSDIDGEPVVAIGRRASSGAVSSDDSLTGPVVVQARLGQPLIGLTPEQLARFEAGKAAFTRIIREEDGLGPAHNLHSCAVCHANPIGGSGTITVTYFGYDGPSGFDPLTELGGPLLQSEAINERCRERIPREANVVVTRISPSALGAGLIEAIPDEAIKAHADHPPAGVSGRVHWVRAIEDPPGGALRAGRFGWKSQVATVRTFSAAAARNELGLTNEYIPVDAAPNADSDLLEACDTVEDPEDRPDSEGYTYVDRVTDFQRFLAPPPQTPRSGMLGEEVFKRIGCADCHTPSFTTADDPNLEGPLRNRRFKPYSNFLLHDMGALGDGIVQGQAEAKEMRTTPLWGFRIRFPVLHDGRVAGSTLTVRATRSIMTHAGEAVEAVKKFSALSAEDTERLMSFLDSLGRVEFDSDGDNDVDEDDYRVFETCYTGDRPGTYTPEDHCSLCDIDQDGDVDLLDHAAFQQAATGPLYGSTMVVP